MERSGSAAGAAPVERRASGGLDAALASQHDRPSGCPQASSPRGRRASRRLRAICARTSPGRRGRAPRAAHGVVARRPADVPGDRRRDRAPTASPRAGHATASRPPPHTGRTARRTARRHRAPPSAARARHRSRTSAERGRDRDPRPGATHEPGLGNGQTTRCSRPRSSETRGHGPYVARSRGGGGILRGSGWSPTSMSTSGFRSKTSQRESPSRTSPRFTPGCEADVAARVDVYRPSVPGDGANRVERSSCRRPRRGCEE